MCRDGWAELDRVPVLIDPLVIPGVDRVLVRGAYDHQVLATLIKKMKYAYWTGLAEVLGDVMRPVAQRLESDEPFVPVPLHGRRRRERGFNQAQTISRALAYPAVNRVKNWLKRSRYTQSQATLAAVQRQQNTRGAFAPVAVANWPSSAILVDDVITTGSTIAECASVLRQSGVQHITAVAIAKG